MAGKLSRKEYEAELARMQAEMVDLQAAVRHEGMRVAVVFEGRDTAGKGGTIAAGHRRAEPARVPRRRPRRPQRARGGAVVLPALHRADAGGR